jgi:hypothetical protein
MAARCRPALSLAALAACLAAASSATAGVPVTAKVTYTKKGEEYRQLVLTIRRGDAVYKRRVGTTYFTKPKVSVRDLDADGEPEVWVDTYTGGAHCCYESRFFRYVPDRRTYEDLLHSWRDPGYRAKNVDGRDGVELVSSDARFAYVFTSFAGSFFPIQYWHFERGRLVDVTRSFPGEIAHDATDLWGSYTNDRDVHADPRGVLAAWVADEILLGRDAAAWRKIEGIRKRGGFGPKPELAGWPQGTAYVKALRAYLRKLGYR